MYKIGEVANILGISVDTIRFYETKNVVNPYKDDESGYRYYDDWDMNFLSECSWLRSFEFSLREITRIINEASLSELRDTFTQRESELRQAVHHYGHLVEAAARTISACDRVDEYLWKCIEEESPDLLLCAYRFRGVYVRDSELRTLNKRLLELYPLVRFSFAIPCSTIAEDTTIDDCLWGFSLNIEDAHASCIDGNSAFIRVPPRRSVYTIIAAGATDANKPRLFSHVIAYIDEHGYKACGDAVGSIIARVHEGGQYVRYIEVWVPIE